MLSSPRPLLVLAAFLLLAAVTVFGLILQPPADALTPRVLVVQVDAEPPPDGDSSIELLNELDRLESAPKR